MRRGIVGLLFALLVAITGVRADGLSGSVTPQIGGGFGFDGGVRGSGGTFPVLVLPAALGAPSAAYSVIRLSGWNGNCMQVQRASDNATLDIGFKGNVVDYVAADVFAGGSLLTIAKWYDESGNGNDFVQPTAANQPEFTQFAQVNGVRPVTFDGFFGSTPQRFMQALFATPFDRVALTTYLMATSRTSQAFNTFFEFMDPTFTTAFASAYDSAGALAYNYTGSQQTWSVRPRSHMQTYSVSFGSPQTMTRYDGNNLPQAAATTQAIGAVRIGKLAVSTNYNAKIDYFGMFIYPASHSLANLALVEAAENTGYQAIRSGWPNRLIYGGSSLIESWFSTLGQVTSWQGQFGKSPNSDVPSWEIYNMGIGGQTMATEFTNRARLTGLINPPQRSVIVPDANSNDIALATFTSQADAENWAEDFYGLTNTGRTTNITLPYVQALLANSPAPQKVVVPTTIARGGFTTANFKEYARLRYNQLVVAGAAANGYTASDRAANPIFATPAAATNPTYYAADQTHLTNAGYLALDQIDKPAIINFVLRRDVGGAANDNRPMGVEVAA